MPSPSKPKNVEEQVATDNKKPYEAPRLTTYGPLRVLTLGGGTMPDPDASADMMIF